jgi:NADH dehydrogenase [ubiquinone] 1 alpha subcomplex assembly factor 2
MEDTTTTQKKAQLGVREPAFETERHVGPGSKVAAAAAAKEKAEAGETSGTGPVTDEVKLGDSEVVNQREETWKKMQKEAEGEGGKEREAGEKKKTEKGPDPWRQDRGGPSEAWQPKAWEPAAGGKK